MPPARYMMTNGILYGIGVGPGDPELITLKALRTIEKSDAVIVPGCVVKDSVAYKIVSQVVKGLDKKELYAVDMPMTKDHEVLRRSHLKGADMICELLEANLQVAFLTLGDPTVYSTYIYIHMIIADRGYRTEIISGVPSFCAVAARLQTSLAKKHEELHIIPASYQIREALKLPGTKVFMKAGKQMHKVKSLLLDADMDVQMIENCGMPDEKVYHGIDEIPEDAGYYSLIIVKEHTKI